MQDRNAAVSTFPIPGTAWGDPRDAYIADYPTFIVQETKNTRRESSLRTNARRA
jgi:hypothetical protein